MGRKASRKSLLLAAKKSVGGEVKVIQDVTQVLFAAAVQIGLNPIGNPGSKVSSLGPAHVFFEDVGLHPAVDPVVIYVAGRTGGCAHLNRRIMGGLEPPLLFLSSPTPSFSLDALPACSPAQLEQAKASINANTRDANPEARNL
jgi:hypothetical protein